MKDLILFTFLAFLLIFRFFSSKPQYVNGQKIRLSSTVFVEPVLYPNRQRLTLSSLKVYLPTFPEIYYGDSVVVEGVVNGDSLDKAVLVKQTSSNNLLLNFKRRLVSFWQKTLPEPHASLVAGIILGFKRNIPQDFWLDLKKTGTTHVVVASGMNVTFVAEFLITTLILLLKRKWAILASILGIVAYSFMAGLEAPIIRAAIMASTVLLAQVLGRLTQTLRIFFLTAFFMLILKPAWITDVGFLLSFGSTLSLILFGTKVHNKLSFIPGIFREGFSTSVAAQIGVAPILFLFFGQFNILSPVVNMLVLWIIPIVMVVGSLGGLIGLVFPLLGQLIIYLIYPLTSWFVWVIHFFANIQF